MSKHLKSQGKWMDRTQIANLVAPLARDALAAAADRLLAPARPRATPPGGASPRDALPLSPTPIIIPAQPEAVE
jgi:hypothetical protein